MHVKIVNGSVDTYPYRLAALQRENPNVSMPAVVDMTEDFLASYGIYPVTLTEQPSFDHLTQNLSSAIPTLIDGVWTQDWSVTNKLQSEAEESIRNERNVLLLETDYLALSDNTLTTEMATYRQALRDIPSQSGFPFNVIFPSKQS